MTHEEKVNMHKKYFPIILHPTKVDMICPTSLVSLFYIELTLLFYWNSFNNVKKKSSTPNFSDTLPTQISS